MKILNTFRTILLISGIILTIPSLYLIIRTQLFITNAVSLTGEISDVRSSTGENGTTYLPTIRFELDGEEYEFESIAGSGNPDTYQRWSTIEVLVDPENPERAEINGRWELWAAVIVVGGFTLLVWICYLAIVHDIWRKKRFRAFMLEHGIPVKAIISDIQTEVIKARNSGVTMRRTIWRVYAKGIVDGKERIFKSNRIPKEPTFYGIKPGADIMVYIHPKRQKKTFMDFSSFPGSELIL